MYNDHLRVTTYERKKHDTTIKIQTPTPPTQSIKQNEKIVLC